MRLIGTIRQDKKQAAASDPIAFPLKKLLVKCLSAIPTVSYANALHKQKPQR